MSGFLTRLFIAGVIGGTIFYLIGRKPLFTLQIQNSRVRLTQGHIYKQFITECDMLARENRIRFAVIRGFQKIIELN